MARLQICIFWALLFCGLLTGCGPKAHLDDKERASLQAGTHAVVILRLTAHVEDMPMALPGSPRSELQCWCGPLNGEMAALQARAPSGAWVEKGWLYVVAPGESHYVGLVITDAIARKAEYRLELPVDAPVVYAGSLHLQLRGHKEPLGRMALTGIDSGATAVTDDAAEARAFAAELGVGLPRRVLLRAYPGTAGLAPEVRVKVGVLVPPDYRLLDRRDPGMGYSPPVGAGGHDPIGSLIDVVELGVRAGDVAVAGVEHGLHEQQNRNFGAVWDALKAELAAPECAAQLAEIARKALVAKAAPPPQTGAVWDFRIERVELFPEPDDRCSLNVIVRARYLRDGEAIYDGVFSSPGDRYRPNRPHEHRMDLPPATLPVKDLADAAGRARFREMVGRNVRAIAQAVAQEAAKP